jgi:hypothetical protein
MKSSGKDNGNVVVFGLNWGEYDPQGLLLLGDLKVVPQLDLIIAAGACLEFSTYCHRV